MKDEYRPCKCQERQFGEETANHSVHKKSGILIWGRVKSEENEPVEGALVQLLRLDCDERTCELVSIAHTAADRKGFYQFEIPQKYAHCQYRVLAGKAASGRSRVIQSKGCCGY